jgi:hypothetical protein
LVKERRFAQFIEQHLITIGQASRG